MAVARQAAAVGTVKSGTSASTTALDTTGVTNPAIYCFVDPISDTCVLKLAVHLEPAAGVCTLGVRARVI